MKTYKIIPANWTTYGHKYEIGKTYKVEGKLKPCKNGFHSCRDLINCYNFYTNLDGLSHVCIVEVSDNSSNDCIDIPNEKIISRKITILKELSQEEIESILIKEINSKHDIKLQCLILETLVSQQKLSVSFLKQFKNKLDLKRVIIYQLLSEDFIEEIIEDLENKDGDFWYYISTYQKLSEDFIREFKDKVYWQRICMNQKLSEGFIEEFNDRVDWSLIWIFQSLSENLKQKYKNEIDKASYDLKSKIILSTTKR